MSKWTSSLLVAAALTTCAVASAQTPANSVDRGSTGEWTFGTGGAAVGFDPGNVTLRTPAADSVHGWQFTANRAITITHLGVYDVDDDGFLEEELPVALWRESDQQLLTDGALSQGTGDMLIDHFRYVDVPDVTLESGRDYVVGYYTAGPLFRPVFDDMASDIIDLEVTVTIDIVQSRFVWPAAGAITYPGGEAANDRFGPNFRFVFGDVCEPCDMNCDGSVDAFDIEPFLGILFEGEIPCAGCTGDANGDGTVDAFDIEPFLNCLFP